MKIREGFVLRTVGEGTVVVPTGENVVDLNGMIVLNETAKFIWERLDGSRSPEQIAEELTEEFDVTEDQALQDIQVFLAELAKLNIIETASSPDQS